MNLGPESNPSIYHAADADHAGATDPRMHPGQLALNTEIFRPDDRDIVAEGIEEFMTGLYDSRRYSEHNDRVLTHLDKYSEAEQMSSDANSSASDTLGMAIILHDFVEHMILRPEHTAQRLGLGPSEAADIKNRALNRFGEIFNAVDDQDGLIKAYLFAIDASKWEAAGKVWRKGATKRIADLMDHGEMDAGSGAIVNAAVKNERYLEHVDKSEIKHTLKKHCLVDLELETISNGTLNYNFEGLFIKGLETLDLLKHPPKKNPASTYRDATEAINFFVPALAALGYKKLATALRGEALQFFFDDPDGSASLQHMLSHKYFDSINQEVTGLLKHQFGGIESALSSRIKTEGSLRQKLASDKYKGFQLVPDGIGFAIVIPDEMAGSEMEYFARSFMSKLSDSGKSFSFVPKDPRGEDPFEDLQAQERTSGYKAIHMTFYYYPEDGSGESVPFEIQVVTKSQDKLHLYGRASHLFRKADTAYSPEDQPHLDHLERRARAAREIAPGSTIYSIAEMIAASPEIPTIFNKLFRAVDTPNGARILVPIALEEVAHEVFDSLDEAFGDPGDLVVLPAARLNARQFLDALRMFNPDLATDKNILNALQIVRSSEKDIMRDDGITSVLDGHILPTALSAVMLAVQSGRQWHDDVLDPNECISNVAVVAILHDYIEDSLDNIQGLEAMMRKRHEMFYEIKNKFGGEVRNGIVAMTLPFEIENDFERREQNKKNIEANEYARDVKPADRWQNHVTDLLKLANKQQPLSLEIRQKIMDYFTKSDRHLSPVFTSSDYPAAYTSVHDVIWKMAKHFGYEQA